MKKEALSGSTQEVSHRILPHLNHHHHHHHHHPLPLHPPSPLHTLPAPKKNPVGLFHFLFCFFYNLSCFQLSFLHSFNPLPEKKLSTGSVLFCVFCFGLSSVLQLLVEAEKLEAAPFTLQLCRCKLFCRCFMAEHSQPVDQRSYLRFCAHSTCCTGPESHVYPTLCFKKQQI